MSYADYEQDLMDYFAEKIVEWKTDVNPIDLPVSWPNMILEKDDYDRTKPWVKFFIAEQSTSQLGMGRGVGCTFKSVPGRIVVDIYYPYDYNYLNLKNIMSKVEDALEQVRIADHTLTQTSQRTDMPEYRGMRSKRIDTNFETQLNK